MLCGPYRRFPDSELLWSWNRTNIFFVSGWNESWIVDSHQFFHNSCSGMTHWTSQKSREGREVHIITSNHPGFLVLLSYTQPTHHPLFIHIPWFSVSRTEIPTHPSRERFETSIFASKHYPQSEISLTSNINSRFSSNNKTDTTSKEWTINTMATNGGTDLAITLLSKSKTTFLDFYTKVFLLLWFVIMWSRRVDHAFRIGGCSRRRSFVYFIRFLSGEQPFIVFCGAMGSDLWMNMINLMYQQNPYIRMWT